MAPWRPRIETLEVLDAVRDVMAEYHQYLPLTVRQVFYRLVGLGALAKSESAYVRLCEYLNRARRAGLLPFSVIRDDGGSAVVHRGYGHPEQFRSDIRAAIRAYRRRFLPGVEIWLEAEGMVPMIADAADPYRVPVYSSGGFDSVTVKHEAATRIAQQPAPVIVLHIGDYDASGLAVVDSAAQDVGQFLADLDAPGWAHFERLAVTPQQISDYGLPTAPPKHTDRRGAESLSATVQVEAFAPDVLTDIVRSRLAELVDLDALADLESQEEADRRALEREYR